MSEIQTKSCLDCLIACCSIPQPTAYRYNVIQYLKEDHPQRLESILQTLSRRIPRLEKVEASIMPNGQLLLQIKDAPFQSPILAKFASDGTLKMLAYLTILYDPSPPQLVGIEEPENHLHPRLLPELAEECRAATAGTQLMVTTHSQGNRMLIEFSNSEELGLKFDGQLRL